MTVLACMMPVSLGTLAASPRKWATTAACWAVYGSFVKVSPPVSKAVTYEEDINVPLLLAHVLLTSSAVLHASPEQAFSAARRSLR
jgi:hypothetical protein